MPHLYFNYLMERLMMSGLNEEGSIELLSQVLNESIDELRALLRDIELSEIEAIVH